MTLPTRPYRTDTMPRPGRLVSHRASQRGLTLVELMVGLVLALLVTLAATAALMASRQGFSAVDATAQLRDNGRFASQLVERVVAQAGYEDHSTSGVKSHDSHFGSGPAVSSLQGYDNTLLTVPTSGPNYTSGQNKGVNGSDVLVVRYQGSSSATTNPATPDAADGSIIDCAGHPQPITTGAPSTSILYVAKSAGGEPSLMCGYQNLTTGNWDSQPLVQGVETFQVRYGVDAPPGSGAATTDLPQQYVNAAALNTGTPTEQAANWQHVKAVRIGMVLRGPPGSAIDRSARAASAVFYPLGATMSDAGDTGTQLTPGADGRLRQAVTFTVYLRNPQW